jgi:hypothetical protein
MMILLDKIASKMTTFQGGFEKSAGLEIGFA